MWRYMRLTGALTVDAPGGWVTDMNQAFAPNISLQCDEPVEFWWNNAKIHGWIVELIDPEGYYTVRLTNESYYYMKPLVELARHYTIGRSIRVRGSALNVAIH